MNIGIVSKIDHCKPHKKALTDMGFLVRTLGSDPTSIPDSLDALVVRVVSVSHGAEKISRMWGKTSGKPVIYQNGVSGMRRAVSILGFSPVAPMVESSFEEVVTPSYSIETEDEMIETQTSFLPSIRVVNREALTPGFKVERVEVAISKVSALIRDSYFDLKEFKEFSEKAREFTKHSLEDFDVDGYTRLLKERIQINSDPVSSMVYFYFFASEGFSPYLRDCVRFNYLFTGCEISGHICRSVAWALGFEVPPNAPRGFLPVPQRRIPLAQDPVQDPVQETQPVPAAQADFDKALDSNTQAILEVMEELSEFKKSVGLKSEQDDSRFEALNHSAKVAFDSIREALAIIEEARTHFHNELEETKKLVEGMTTSPPSSPSGNPLLEALQSIGTLKSTLSAAGFKGTLTITVE